MRRILLVDDDARLTLITQRRLEHAGFEVATTNHSFGVLNLVAMTRPDVVLMDMNMPGLNGSELVNLLRQDAELCETRVLFYSGIARAELRCICKSAGANGFVHKMDKFDDLVNTLRE